MFDQLMTLDPVAVTKVADFATFFSVVSVCAGILYLVYRFVAPADADEREFAATVFILTVAIGLLVSIIKHAPAISFGLFGAMSIVRFRSQIKRPQRMIFIFMAAAIGVCCGAGEYMTTILGTIVLSALTLLAFSFTPMTGKATSKAAEKAAARALQAATPPALDAGPVSRWGVDLLPVALADGRRLRVLAVVDEGSREALAVVAETSISAARVIGELDRLIIERGKPHSIVSESWPQFASSVVVDWKRAQSIDWVWLDQTAKVQPFIGTFAAALQDKILSVERYAGLMAARTSLENWRLGYNQSLGIAADDPTARRDRAADTQGPRLAVATALREPVLVEGEAVTLRVMSSGH